MILFFALIYFHLHPVDFCRRHPVDDLHRHDDGVCQHVGDMSPRSVNMKETFITVFPHTHIDRVSTMSVDENVEQPEKNPEKKDEVSLEEKIEKVKAIEALRKSGYTVEEACKIVGIHRTTYYKWRDEVSEHIKDDEPKTQVPKEVADTYKLLEEYGFKTPSSGSSEAPSDPVEELLNLKKKLDKAKAILGGGESVNTSGGEELEEIKKAIGYLLKRVEELQRGQVYMGRVRKVKYPDGTEVEYDLMPTDYATVKQANTMYDRVVPETLNELKGMRQDLTMFANRLLGLIETNFAHEIKKAPGFFLNVRKRSKEEREKELEDIMKMLEERELLSLKVGGGVNEISSGNEWKGRSGEDYSLNESGNKAK